MKNRVPVFALLLGMFALPASAQQDDFNAQWRRFGDLGRAKRFEQAIELGLRLEKIRPREWVIPENVSRLQSVVGAFRASEATLTRAIKKYALGRPVQSLRVHVELYVGRAFIRRSMGEVAAGLRDLEKASTLDPRSLQVAVARASLYDLVGRHRDAIKEVDRVLEGLPPKQTRFDGMRLSLFRIKADALRGLGRDKEALSYYAKFRGDRSVKRFQGRSGMARVYALSRNPRMRDLSKAGALLDKIDAESGVFTIYTFNSFGIVEYLAGRYSRAQKYFAAMKGASDTEAVFYHGLTRLKMGDRQEAIRLVTMAAGLRKRYRASVEQDRRLVSIRREVLARLGDLASLKKVARRADARRTQELAAISLSQINGFVRAFDFRRALADLARYRAQVEVPSVRKEVDQRAKQIGLFAQLLDKLVQEIRTGSLKGARLMLGDVSELTLELIDASRKGFRVRIKDKGVAGGSWADLAFADRWKLLSRLSLNFEQWVALSHLALDMDEPKLAEKSLAKAWTLGASRREQVGRLVARLRKQKGKFVLFKGRFVSAGDRSMLASGLVRFRGKWVSKRDRYHLSRNHVKQGGRWIPLTEAQLRARGYTRYKGQWVTPQELTARKGKEAYGWQEKTAHWVIKTNISQKFARRLAVALEQSYAVYKQFFGKEPRGTRPMTALAFRSYEDYRKYCKKTNNMDSINAAGFSPSEPRTCCGYDKLKDHASLIRTMVHEGAHLYYQLTFAGKTPSWIAEGMATYFEGFKVDSKGNLKFHHKARSRYEQVKAAISNRKTIPLSEMIDANAGKLINSDANKALVFYAQAWGYFYFFHKTGNARYRAAFQKYLDGVKRGSPPKLRDLLGDLGRVEKDFYEFMRGM